MIPAGQESATRRSVDRDEERSALSLLLDTVEQLVATASSGLPRDQQLVLLQVQIGTLKFWADALTRAVDDRRQIPAPHFGAGAGTLPGERTV